MKIINIRYKIIKMTILHICHKMHFCVRHDVQKYCVCVNCNNSPDLVESSCDQKRLNKLLKSLLEIRERSLRVMNFVLII